MKFQSNAIKLTKSDTRAPEYKWSAKTYLFTGLEFPQDIDIVDFWAYTREEALSKMMKFITWYEKQ